MGALQHFGTPTYTFSMEQNNSNASPVERLQTFWKGVKQSNPQAQLHYAIFQATQRIKQRNHSLADYKKRFMGDWEKWLGIGMGFTGLLLLLNPDGLWRWQFPIIALIVLAAPYFADIISTLKKPFTEYPGKQLIGQVVTLDEAIVDGKSEIRLDNQTWYLSGNDTPAGTQVRIIALSDRTLYITPVKSRG